MSDLMKIGADMGAAGAFKPLTAGISGAQRVSDAHGRFMQAALEGRLFSGGMGLTSINNVTFTTGTLGATCTPIAGVVNPSTSTKNLVILQAVLGITVTALINTGGGPFVWATSTGNTALLSASVAAFNRLTLVKSGGQGADIAGVALTGLAANLSVRFGSALFGGRFSNINGPDTAAGWSTTQCSSVENFDGSIIVPPGGVLALLATTTPVAHSAVSSLLWEEVPILVQG